MRLAPVDTDLALVDVQDVTFAGSGGTDVRAWLRTPAGATGPLPTVVSYVGYGGGRGRAEETLIYAAAGFAHLQMDTRGQGSYWSAGDTADHGEAGPAIPGFMTRGIASRDTYYYRRLFTDAVRAVDVARSLDVVDPARIAVQGGSQGGGMALAVAGLRDDVAAVSAYVPFLCDIERATHITDAYPYHEVVDYLRTHRGRGEDVHAVLRYFDGVAFSRRATRTGPLLGRAHGRDLPTLHRLRRLQLLRGREGDRRVGVQRPRRRRHRRRARHARVPAAADGLTRPGDEHR